MLAVLSIAIVLQLAHHLGHRPQGNLLPTTRHSMLVHVMIVFLAIALSLKEDPPVRSINSTRRVVILDSKLAQDIRGSLLCQYNLHLNKLHLID
jgi:hypothetical protein